MPKENKNHNGFASTYKPIVDTLDLPLATVRFNKLLVTFHKKVKGRLTDEKLETTYETPHGVAVVYGRLKNDSGLYLAALLHKLEQARQKELFKKQQEKIAKKATAKRKK
jgi:hypothetical protein